MKNIVKMLGFIAVTAIIGFGFAACDDPDAGLPALTGTVTITGTAQVGQTLTANTGSLGGSGTITYQWRRGTTNIGTNSNTYIVQTEDVGSTIIVIVTRSDNSGSVTSNPTSTVIAVSSTLTGTVTITGTAQVGQTLAVNISNLGGSGIISFQWKRSGSAVIGSNSTYEVAAADAGHTITVTVTRSDNSGSVTSAPTATVTEENLKPLPVPVETDFVIGNFIQIEGNVTAVTITPQEGKSTGEITIFYDGSETLPSAAGVYAVTFNVAAVISWNEAVGLNGGALVINEKTNAQTPEITNQPINATVTINNTHTLSVTANVTDNGTLTYQWYSNTSASNTGGTQISGAVSAAYNPPAGTLGTYYYFVEITNTIADNGDGGNKTATARSNAVTLIVNARVNAQAPNITNQPINATVTINNTRTLSVTANVTDNGTLTYQWYSNTSASNTGGTIISDAVSATYNPPTGTAGTFHYFVQVTNTIANNGDGGIKTATARSVVVRVMVIPPVEMVWIPAGTFTQGSPASEMGHSSEETQRQVTISRGFYMGKYEVTQEQYQAVMGVNPSLFIGSNHPVEIVTWFDAVEFCNRLSVIEGLTPAYTITGRTPATGYPIYAATVTVNWNANGYRLPTEAEWEYACRAGTTTAYNTGASITTSQANISNTLERTTVVGSYAPNAWGLYDMHGNVLEWCWDWYGTYASGAQTDPRGADSGAIRVLRGGSWDNSAWYSRSATRIHSPPINRNNRIGFRLVRP